MIHKAFQASLGYGVFLTACCTSRRPTVLLTLSSVEITSMDTDGIFGRIHSVQVAQGAATVQVEFWVARAPSKRS